MADDEHTGGMIALILRPDDAQALAVPRGDDPDELHLTSVYLGGDVTGMDNRERNAIAAAVASIAVMLPPVRARVFAHAVFNPDNGPDDARPPCAVYLVGDAPDIARLHDELRRFGAAEMAEPYIPHVTAGYGVPVTKLSFTGPVVFDTLRLALGNDHYDFPLGEPMQKGMDMVTHIETKRYTVAPSQADVDPLWLDFEAKVMSPSPNAAKLREYWAHGEGRKKWRPGTPGDFKRLRRHLAKYVHDPRILDGLTANIHKLATGEWPGPKAHSHKGADAELGLPENAISAEEFKAAMLLADPDADLDDDLLSGGDTDSDVDLDDPDDEDDAYVAALMDEWLYFLNADGELEPDPDAAVGDEEMDHAEDDKANRVGPRAANEYISLFD